MLLDAADPDPARWSFTGGELLRARRLSRLERDFDANPELAGLGADTRFGIRSIPTPALFHKGREIARQSAVVGAADLIRWTRATAA